MEIPLTFNGRKYRLSVAEAEALAAALTARGTQPRHVGIPFRHHDDDTFAALAERLRQAAAPPVSALELQGHEAAAMVLTQIDVSSSEFQRFCGDYAAENLWPNQPFSRVIAPTIQACFAFKIGRWFFEDGLLSPIGGLDEETGEDLSPRAVDFAAHAAANATFAEVASVWAKLRGSTFGDERLVTDDTLAWLRGERDRAATAAVAASDPVEEAEAGARAWALREAGLWLESCANRARRPWEAPRHEA